MALYDLFVDALGKLRVAEHFTVEGGFIVKIRQIHDTHGVRKGGFAKFGARAVADTTQGSLLATVDLSASPARVFQALTSTEVTRWWVRPGIFDTREWSGDIRVGGHWRGRAWEGDDPYALEGEFLEIDSPHKLVHAWRLVEAPGKASVVTYRLEPIQGGTRLARAQA